MIDIRFSPEAHLDLQEIREYIAEDLSSPSAAGKLISDLLEAIKVLSAFPEMGTPLSAVISVETDYRFLLCRNYLAFYRFEADTVYIVRILNGRRNYMEILFGQPDE